MTKVLIMIINKNLQHQSFTYKIYTLKHLLCSSTSLSSW